MKLKLKEDPREWLKFTAVMALAVAIAAISLRRRHWLSPIALDGILIALVGATLVCAVRPRWFRSFYRAGMTANFFIGSFLGRVWLTLFFVLVLTPLGLILRLCGKDLLQLKKSRSTASYWKKVERPNDLDRQF